MDMRISYLLCFLHPLIACNNNKEIKMKGEMYTKQRPFRHQWLPNTTHCWKSMETRGWILVLLDEID